MKDILSKYPYALEPYVIMNDVNAPIVVYAGKFLLQNDECKVQLDGNIKYNWGQRCRIVFEGTSSFMLSPLNKVNIYIQEHKCAEGIITLETDACNEPVYIKGELSELTFGDTFENCDKICFALINQCDVYGELIRRGENGGSRDRLTFNGGGYSIIIENRDNITDFKNKIHEGFCISHYCQITRQDGLISLKNADEILTVFAMYISFVNGKRCAPFFVYGYKNGVKICEHHSVGCVPTSRNTSTWAPRFEFEYIKLLWNNFYEIWQQNKDSKDVLLTAIHWYVEANANSGALEGAYIMAFAGIELMYNVLIGTEGHSTAKKIKSLIIFLNVSSEISADELCKFRNYLVHYGQKNRAAYSEIDNRRKIQYMECVICILELSILKYLDYQGLYVNRLKDAKYQGEAVEVVPYHSCPPTPAITSDSHPKNLQSPH